MKSPAKITGYHELKKDISELLLLGRQQAGRAINTILVQTYWQIGRHIVEFEQGGRDKAEYGTNLLDRLSSDLSVEFGKGFSRSNLTYMRKLYQYFPIRETLSHKLSWSHFFEILKSDEPLEVSFYTQLSNRHFFVDLVFYHRILKCFVLIDLKRGEIDHQDIGQMNLYLNYFKKRKIRMETVLQLE
jgi:predicted nuclease of restriction endonuclease-like (RecB) superfamily